MPQIRPVLRRSYKTIRLVRYTTPLSDLDGDGHPEALIYALAISNDSQTPDNLQKGKSLLQRRMLSLRFIAQPMSPIGVLQSGK